MRVSGNIKIREGMLGSELQALLHHRGPWYKQRHLLQLNFILLVPLISTGAVGFDGAMMNGLQTLPQWREYFNHPTGALLGIMNAVYPIGKIIGILVASILCDRFGRKLPIWLGLPTMIVGAVVQGGAQNLAMFMIARFVLGFGNSLIALPMPILVAELAYPTHRGKITALYNTFYYVGAIMAAWVTYGTFKIPDTSSWRIPSILQATIPFLQLCFCYFVPESPRWLIAHNKEDQALEILARYHSAGDKSSALITFEMAEICENIEFEKTVHEQTCFADLFRTRQNRRRACIAVICGIFVQWAGNGVVSYYLTLVLNTIGITTVSSQVLINGLLQVFNWFVAVVGGALMVDRMGRRTLFLTSAIGMLCSYVIWTVLTSVFVRTLDAWVGHAVVAFIFIYYLFYDIAWTPLMPAYPVEIWQYTMRSRGVTFSMVVNYLGLILGQVVNPIAMKNIGWRYYIVFCCLLASLVVMIYFLFPETKGRTLEEIARIFDGPQSASSKTDQRPFEQKPVEMVVEHRETFSRNTDIPVAWSRGTMG